MESDLYRCALCGAVYDWRKSTSRYRRLTYDSYTCERKAEGFLIEDFDSIYRATVKGLPNDPEVIEAFKELMKRQHAGALG